MILLAAIVATPGGNIAHAQAPADRSAQRDLDHLRSTLENPEAADKDEAARRLVSRDTPEARAILNNVLDSAERSGQLAVARALAADPSPNAQFIGPLQKLLSNDPQLTEAAAQALAQFKDN